MNTNQSEQLKKLRKIILQEDVQRVVELEKELGEIRDRIDDTDEWLEMLDPVIADALSRKISESKEEMAETLAPVMGAAIKTQIQDAKEDMVDALYPVIGSTIRKSIAEAMKNLAKTVNEKVDQALSFRLFFSKIKSRIAGVSKGELVLKESLPFKIQEIFLIHKETGILLAHVSQLEQPSTPEQEIISGMLTAIRDFARTAFSQNGKRELNEIKYDDLQIYLEDGRYAYLAVVVSDLPPEKFPARLKQCEHQVHQRFYKELRVFDGNVEKFADSKKILRRFFNEFSLHKKPEQTGDQKGKSIWRGLVYILLAVVLVAVVYFTLIKFDLLKLTTTKPALTNSELAIIIRNVEEELSDIISEDLSNLQYVIDGNTLLIDGRVSTETEKLLIGKAFAGHAYTGLIVNNLMFDHPITSIPTPVIRQIESTTIHFEQNNSSFTAENNVLLDMVAALLKTYQINKIFIHAHSDNLGTSDINQTLSQQRAEQVRQYLVTAGVDSSRLQTYAWGAQKPVASNNTEQGRAQNRRVEFKFSREE